MPSQRKGGSASCAGRRSRAIRGCSCPSRPPPNTCSSHPPPAPGAPGPFSFADDERVRGILEAAGFSEVLIDPLDSQLALGGNVSLEEAVSFIVEGIGPTAAILREHPDQRDAVLSVVTEALAPFARPGGVALPCAAWIVTASR